MECSFSNMKKSRPTGYFCSVCRPVCIMNIIGMLHRSRNVLPTFCAANYYRTRDTHKCYAHVRVRFLDGLTIDHISHGCQPGGDTPICRPISSVGIMTPLFLLEILHPMNLFFNIVHTQFSKFQHKISKFSLALREFSKDCQFSAEIGELSLKYDKIYTVYPPKFT